MSVFIQNLIQVFLSTIFIVDVSVFTTWHTVNHSACGVTYATTGSILVTHAAILLKFCFFSKRMD